MAASETNKESDFWAWSNQDHLGTRDYLLVADSKLYFEGVVQDFKFGKLKDSLLSSGPQAIQERIEADSRKRLRAPFARVIPFDKVQAAEYVPLLASHLTRIRYVSDEGKEQTLTLKISPNEQTARHIFERLRAHIAPESVATQEQASRWTAIRGPVLSLVLGGGWLLLAAVAATADERTWREKTFILYALVGWLIRFLGPVWLTVIAAVWIGASALLLWRRLKNPPTIQVWTAK